ncbi:MAG: metallophosphoesterase [archaeon]
MLLGLFSDSHLGFKGEDRYEESFARFKESLELFKKLKVDYILHAGDLFDDAVPEQEVWLKTFECWGANNGSLSELTRTYLGTEKKANCKGIPIIAIHGTHEFRGKDFANALDILEESNCLVHVHAGHCCLEKNGEKVYVHGMGGVPEKNAKAALEKYAPKPIHNHRNILLLHQSFTEFLPFDDDSIASLSLTDLPNGFDLIINGHLHWTQEQDLGNKRFLLTGSAIFTQMKKLEANMPKGIYLLETKEMKLTFVPFEHQRKLFYEKMNFKSAKPDDVMVVVNEKVDSLLKHANFELRPLVRLKLTGTLAKGFSQSDVSLDFSKYAKSAVFSIQKSFVIENFQKKIEHLKEAQLEKKSVVDLGVELLEKNVDEAGLKNFETRRIFDLLSIGENEKAEVVLLANE